jgi:Flp pilus assembly protein TadG
MVGGALMRLRAPVDFLRNTRGVAAVEFAIILPVMLLLYLGCNELGNGLTIARKVTHVTSTVSDLVTQSKGSISSSEMTNIMNAAAAIMTPYPTTLLRIRVSQYKVDKDKKVTIDWTSTYNNPPALPAANKIDLPSGLKPGGSDIYLISAEVHYAYTPTIGYVMTGTFDIADQFYLRPRTVTKITGPS